MTEPVIISREYWAAIERQATTVQVLIEALQKMTEAEAFVDLAGYADHLEEMSAELFSLTTDEGGRRANIVQAGKHLRLVGD